MTELKNILKMRVLLSFYYNKDSCTVTRLAKMLGVEKYTISRILKEFEEQGLVDKSIARQPVLSEKGMLEASFYAERVTRVQNYLLYHGLDIDVAKRDAYYCAAYCSEQTIQLILKNEMLCRIKCEDYGKCLCNGEQVCKKMENGQYKLQFMIYRVKPKGNSYVSMANEGFEHPCILSLKEGVGTIQLRSKQLKAKSVLNGKWLVGKADNIQYFDNGEFYEMEKSGDIFTFPASALQMKKMGAQGYGILYAQVLIKIRCSVGAIHMPEAMAMLSIVI